MEKSAVEWLVNELDLDMDLDSKCMIEQAKEMFEQQIRSAWNSAYGGDSNYTAEQYYNETFKTK